MVLVISSTIDITTKTRKIFLLLLFFCEDGGGEAEVFDTDAGEVGDVEGTPLALFEVEVGNGGIYRMSIHDALWLFVGRDNREVARTDSFTESTVSFEVGETGDAGVECFDKVLKIPGMSNKVGPFEFRLVVVKDVRHAKDARMESCHNFQFLESSHISR